MEVSVIKKHLTAIVLFALLLILSIWSLFVGVLDVELSGLLHGDSEHLAIFLISRLPRLLAILCTGTGMSVAGLIMQQLCMNKFVSPTTGATISSAQFGILLALLFLPNSTLWGRAIFSFVFAVLGTWMFVWFIQRVQFKDVVMVPLVGIMFGNVIGFIENHGRNFTCCGFWKSYGDPAEMQVCFACYRRCIQTYVAMFEQGIPIERLAVPA